MQGAVQHLSLTHPFVIHAWAQRRAAAERRESAGLGRLLPSQHKGSQPAQGSINITAAAEGVAKTSPSAPASCVPAAFQQAHGGTGNAAAAQIDRKHPAISIPSWTMTGQPCSTQQPGGASQTPDPGLCIHLLQGRM